MLVYVPSTNLAGHGHHETTTLSHHPCSFDYLQCTGEACTVCIAIMSEHRISDIKSSSSSSIVDESLIDQDVLWTANHHLVVITIHIDYLAWQPGSCWLEDCGWSTSPQFGSGIPLF